MRGPPRRTRISGQGLSGMNVGRTGQRQTTMLTLMCLSRQRAQPVLCGTPTMVRRHETQSISMVLRGRIAIRRLIFAQQIVRFQSELKRKLKRRKLRITGWIIAGECPLLRRVEKVPKPAKVCRCVPLQVQMYKITSLYIVRRPVALQPSNIFQYFRFPFYKQIASW